MKNHLVVIFFSFFLCSFANAGLEGSGPLKLDSEVVKFFNKYLGTKDQNTKSGALKHGRGTYFFVSESGRDFGYSYCPQTYIDGCVQNPSLAKNQCRKDVKNYLKNNEKCRLFAKDRYIVWGGKKVKIKNKASPSEVDAILRHEGFID